MRDQVYGAELKKIALTRHPVFNSEFLVIETVKQPSPSTKPVTHQGCILTELSLPGLPKISLLLTELSFNFPLDVPTCQWACSTVKKFKRVVS